MSAPQTEIAPTADAIEERAAEWLVKRHAHAGWTAEQEAELESWLTQSWAHRTAYWRLSAAWSCADRVGTLHAPRPMASARNRNGRTVVRIAAVVVLSAVLGVVGYRYSQTPREKTYATGLGGHEIVTLTDGSQIELNTNTVLHIATGTRERSVRLDRGEAYFQIVHNAAHPFTVAVGGRRIIDLGTKFLVKADADRLKVSLMEGLARIEFADAPSSSSANLLKPGDVAVATADSISVTRADTRSLNQELGWRRGVLIFRDTSLAEAVAEFNRYNSRKIVIADAGAARRTIGGTFTTSEVSRFAAIVRLALSLDVEERGGQIFISSNHGRAN